MYFIFLEYDFFQLGMLGTFRSVWVSLLLSHSVVSDFETLCSTPCFPALHYLPEFAQIQAQTFIHPSHPLSFPSPAFSLSQNQGLFQWVGSLHRVAKVLEFQLQHQSFQWIFRVDFLYDWVVWSPCYPRDSQESSLAPQFESINSQHSAFFIAHLSHLYMTTGKTIVLPIPTFVYKMITLLFNMLSKLVIAFLPRSKCLNFMAGVTIHSDFGAQEKAVTVSIVSPSICHKMMGPMLWSSFIWMF